MIKKILVPVDFSPGSIAALRYAESFATFTRAVDIKVIHVFTPQVATGDALVVPPMGELMDSISFTSTTRRGSTKASGRACSPRCSTTPIRTSPLRSGR